jgi:hypothetical protein
MLELGHNASTHDTNTNGDAALNYEQQLLASGVVDPVKLHGSYCKKPTEGVANLLSNIKTGNALSKLYLCEPSREVVYIIIDLTPQGLVPSLLAMRSFFLSIIQETLPHGWTKTCMLPLAPKTSAAC